LETNRDGSINLTSPAQNKNNGPKASSIPTLQGHGFNDNP